MFLLINSTVDIAFYTISVLSANSPCPKSKYLTNCHVTHVLLSHKEARKLNNNRITREISHICSLK